VAEESQQFAEAPRNGEGWTDMIQRQREQGNPTSGYSRELLRSLPLEQRDPPSRGDNLTPDPQPEMQMSAYDAALMDASRVGGQGYDREQSVDR
jgi:hypothetical protein